MRALRALGTAVLLALLTVPLAAQSPDEFRFVPPDTQAGMLFGRPVALVGDLVAIAANTFPGPPIGGPSRDGEIFLYRRSGPNAWTQFQRIAATGAVIEDSDLSTAFGSAFDFTDDGRVLIVGDPDDDGVGFDAGAVYVFLRQPDGTYAQTAKITNPLGDVGRFGDGLVVGSDGRFVVSAPRAEGPSGQSFAGAVLVYGETTPGIFELEATVFSPFPATVQGFGSDIAFDGPTLVVGVPSFGLGRGAAFVFRERGGTWTLVAQFNGAQILDDFGSEVAVEGTTLAIGAQDAGPATKPGEILLYDETAPDTWTLVTTLTNPDPREFGTGGVSFFAGCRLVLAGNRLAACGLTPVSFGAAPEGGPGFAFIYERTDEGWVLLDTIIPSNGTNEDFFSQGLAFDGTTLIAGAPLSGVFGVETGAAYAYVLDGTPPPPPPPGEDVTAPALSGAVAGRQYEGTARDDRTNDTGIATLALRDATNLTLTPDAFVAGDAVVAFTVTLQNRRAQGKGFAVATDVAGNESTLWICSDGCPPPDDPPPPPPGMDETDPVVSGSIERNAFEGTATDAGSGIASVTLGADAVNLRVSVDAFATGDAEVGFTVRLQNPREPGSGTVIATDVAGNEGRLFIDSEDRAQAAMASVAGLPAVPTLRDAYPNPFAAQTRIGYTVPEAMPVRLSVYDVTGRLVARLADGIEAAGVHERVFAADGLPSGLYVVRLEAGATVETRRLVLLR